LLIDKEISCLTVIFQDKVKEFFAEVTFFG